jgi:hypothetical protein
MSYDWDHNVAVVDRLFYWEYIIRGTTLTALALTAKDTVFIRRNWYADRAKRRIPLVGFIIIFYVVLGLVGSDKFSHRLVLTLAINK